jgi:hypothetical protein
MPKPSASAPQSLFHKVGENLYGLESSRGYYALLERAGKQFKQFRRSLKTKDRKLAERRGTTLGRDQGKNRLPLAHARPIWGYTPQTVG